MAHIPRTLIADDQPDVLAALRLLLKAAGYHTESADSPSAVLEAVKKQDFDVVLMDLNYARDTTSGKEGFDLISRIQAEDNTLPIVVMTAWGTVDLAVEAPREDRVARGRVLARRQNLVVLERLRLPGLGGIGDGPHASTSFIGSMSSRAMARAWPLCL